MSAVTPMRPDSEPAADDPVAPINTINMRLSQARAVLDPLQFSDHEALYTETTDNALWAVQQFIDDAKDAAEKLHSAYWALRKEPQP